jgi:hypothetical protein
VDPGVITPLLALLWAAPVPEAGSGLALPQLLSLLEHEERKYEIWRWGWTAGYGALTAASLAFVPGTPDHDTRVDLYVGAASSALATLPLLVFSQPQHDPTDAACAVSAEACAQASLRRVAAFQRECQGPLMHALNFGYNAAVGGLLGFGYGHWRAAALNFGVGSLLGEVQILTQPTGAMRALGF